VNKKTLKVVRNEHEILFDMGYVVVKARIFNGLR
jgi:hypothetical protein